MHVIKKSTNLPDKTKYEYYDKTKPNEKRN